MKQKDNSVVHSQAPYQPYCKVRKKGISGYLQQKIKFVSE
jgi:hypothetical protein